MMRFIRKNKTWMMVLAFFMCLVFAITMTEQITVSAAGGTGAATSYSFETIARAAAQYLGHSQEPEGHGLEGFKYEQFVDGSSDSGSGSGSGAHGYSVKISHMGGLVGYQPPKDNKQQFGADSSFYLASTGAGNTTVYTMESLSSSMKIDVDSISDGSDSDIDANADYGYIAKFSLYAQYGYLLGKLGFDQTCIGTQSDSWRMLLGGLILVAYLLSLGLSAFFALLFDLLNFANPLRLFLGEGSVIFNVLSTYNIPETPTSVDISDFSTVTVSTAVQAGVAELVKMLTSFYNNLYNLSWSTIIPIFFATALFSWLVVKQSVTRPGQNMGTTFIDSFKKLGIRMLFATLGIPLLLACYTTALGFVNTFCVRTTNMGTSIVLHTFVDFENWVYDSRLSLPADTSILFKTKYNTVSVGPYGSRYLCAKINMSIHGDASTSYLYPQTGIVSDRADSYLYSGSASSELAYERYVLSQLSSSDTTTVSFEEGTAVSSDNSYNTEKLGTETRDIVNLLERYMKGDIVTSSSFESERMSQLKSDVWSDEAVVAMFNASLNYRDFDSKCAVDLHRNTGEVSVDLDEDAVLENLHGRFSRNTWDANGKHCVNIWNDGSPIDYGADFGYAGGSLYCVDDGPSYTNRYLTFMSDSEAQGHGKGRNGLSSMSMYNYLSSSFDTNSVTVYSTGNSSTDQVVIGHYSVNAVGSGVMSVINIVNALVLLASISVIGYLYGFSMMMSNFKAMFKIIMPVFSGMLGFMSGIAATVVLVCAMIINILVTCVLYSVACDIMYVIYNIVELPLIVIFSSIDVDASVYGTTVSDFLSSILTPLLGVLSIVLIVTIIKQLLRLRTAVVKSATEVTTSMVNKFLATAVAAPNLDASGATAAQKLVNAAGVGASLAMGSMATSNNGDGTGTNSIKDKLSSFGEKLGLGTGAEDAEGTAGDGTNGANGEDGSTGVFGVKTGNGTGETPGVDEKSSGTNTETNTDVLNKTNAEGRKPGMSAGGDDRGVNAEEQAQAYLDNKSGAVDALSGNDTSNGGQQADNNNNAESGNGKVSLVKTDKNGDRTSDNAASDASSDSTTSSDTTSGNNKVSLDKNGKSSKLVGDDALPDNNATEDSRDSDTENKTDGTDKTQTRSGTLTEKLRLDKTTETEVTDGSNADSSLSADGQVEGTKFANMNARPNANDTVNNGTEAFVNGTTNAIDGSSDNTTNAQNPTSKFVGDNSTTNSQLTVDNLAGNNVQSGGYYVGGNTNEPYQVVCDKTGKPYTAADQAGGLSYSVLGNNGKPLTDASGTTYAGMVAGTVQFGAGGQIQSMVNPINGTTTAFTPAAPSGSVSGGSFGGNGPVSAGNVTPVIIAGTTGGSVSGTPTFTAASNNNTVTAAPANNNASVPAYAAPANNGATTPVYTAGNGGNNGNTQAGPVYVQGAQATPNSGITQSGAVNVAVNTSNGGLTSTVSGGTSDSSHSDTVINQQINNGTGGSGNGPVYVNTMGGGSEGPSVQTVEVGGGIPYVDSDAQPTVIPAAPAATQEASVQAASQEPVVIVDKSDSNNNSSNDNNSSDNEEDTGESGIARAFSGIANAVASTLKESHNNKNKK